MLNIFYLILLALLSTVSANLVKFTDCAAREIKNIDVSSCSGDNQCKVETGEDVAMIVEFISKKKCKSAELEIMARMGELEVRVPGIDSDACNGHLKCPLESGASYSLRYDITVPKLIPQNDAETILKLICADDQSILACGSIRGAIFGLKK